MALGEWVRSLGSAFGTKESRSRNRMEQVRRGEVEPRSAQERAVAPRPTITNAAGTILARPPGVPDVGTAADFGMTEQQAMDQYRTPAQRPSLPGAAPMPGAEGQTGGGTLTAYASATKPTVGYQGTYADALARQRQGLADQFRMAIAENERRTQSRQGLVPMQQADIDARYAAQNAGLTQYGDAVAQAQQAAGLGALPGSQEAMTQLFRSAADMIQGGERSNLGYLTQGIGELGQRERVALDQANMAAMAALAQQEAEYAAEMERMQAQQAFEAQESAATRAAAEDAQMSWEERQFNQLSPEDQARARAQMFEIATMAEPFGNISSSRGATITPGKRSQLQAHKQYVPVANKIKELWTEAAGDENTFSVLVSNDPLLSRYPMLASTVLFNTFGPPVRQ